MIDAVLKQEIEELKARVEKVVLPPLLKEKVLDMIVRLGRVAKFGGYSSEYEKVTHYIEWVVTLPWDKETDDQVDLKQAQEILNKHHYGMEDIKERVLEHLAVLKLIRQKHAISRAPILCLVGLVGTGKTTLGPALAEVLGRQFARIPFGGMGSALDLRGQSRLHPDAEPGQVIKALRRAKVKNPVIMLDEIDRMAQEARADIMGVLIELLDPEQNAQFTDHFIDFPFDLSNVLFIATANNTTNISTAVLDRLEVLQMPSYNDEEKIAIGRDYVLPGAIQEHGLSPENLTIEDEVWPQIVRPLGFDGGIRTLERNIQAICRKVAKLIVEGKGQHFHLNKVNIKEFIPRW
ncbi:AAA family ATPase [Patescibacteria group bacterium]|nr:AAA family ATPase [Patescibacteria group bacterium]MBU1931071.1 AAA family ATPase [Patescibacteria group bacterium]